MPEYTEAVQCLSLNKYGEERERKENKTEA